MPADFWILLAVALFALGCALSNGESDDDYYV